MIGKQQYAGQETAKQVRGSGQARVEIDNDGTRIYGRDGHQVWPDAGQPREAVRGSSQAHGSLNCSHGCKEIIDCRFFDQGHSVPDGCALQGTIERWYQEGLDLKCETCGSTDRVSYYGMDGTPLCWDHMLAANRIEDAPSYTPSASDLGYEQGYEAP